MISKLLNIIYLVLLIVCVCVLIRVVKAEPAAVPVAASNGTVAFEVPRIEVSASETKKFAADKFEMGFSLEIRGKDKESVSKRLAERRSVIFENVKSLEIPQSNVEQNSVEMHKEWSYRNSKRELVGYVATQSFVITVNRKIDAAALVQALSSEMSKSSAHPPSLRMLMPCSLRSSRRLAKRQLQRLMIMPQALAPSSVAFSRSMAKVAELSTASTTASTVPRLSCLRQIA